MNEMSFSSRGGIGGHMMPRQNGCLSRDHCLRLVQPGQGIFNEMLGYFSVFVVTEPSKSKDDIPTLSATQVGT